MTLWIRRVLAIVMAAPSAAWAEEPVQPAATVAAAMATVGPAIEAPVKLRKKGRTRRKRAPRWRPNFVQLQAAPGLRLTEPDHAWGTELTVKHLANLVAAHHEAHPNGPPIWVHDISRRRGGRLRPHLSHRRGHDVDIRLALRTYTDQYRKASPRTLDVEHTWFMIKHLIDTGDVEVIFLDRRLQRAVYQHALKQGFTAQELQLLFEHRRNPTAIIRHWKGHDDHIHVRFRRAPHPVPMV